MILVHYMKKAMNKYCFLEKWKQKREWGVKIKNFISVLIECLVSIMIQIIKYAQLKSMDITVKNKNQKENKSPIIYINVS